MSTSTLSTVNSAPLARILKWAWLGYWVVLVALLTGWRYLGDLLLVGHGVLVAVTIWLAIAVWRAASASGHTGILWGIGVVVLGPLGALLLPWLALSKLKGRQ